MSLNKEPKPIGYAFAPVMNKSLVVSITPPKKKISISLLCPMVLLGTLYLLGFLLEKNEKVLFLGRPS